MESTSPVDPGLNSSNKSPELPHPQVDSAVVTSRSSPEMSASHVDAAAATSEESREMSASRVDTNAANSEESSEIVTAPVDEQPANTGNEDNNDEVQVDEDNVKVEEESEEDTSADEAEGHKYRKMLANRNVSTKSKARVDRQPTARQIRQQQADRRHRGKRQGKVIIDRIIGNWEPASIGDEEDLDSFTPKRGEQVDATNQILLDIINGQTSFVKAGKNKGGKVFMQVDDDGDPILVTVSMGPRGNRQKVKVDSTCSVIDAAQEAFDTAIDATTEGDYVRGLKRTRDILGRYVDPAAYKKAKKNGGKGSKKKVQVDEDDDGNDGEDISCVGIDKTITKDDEDDDNGPEGNGGGVFDHIPSGIAAA